MGLIIQFICVSAFAVALQGAPLDDHSSTTSAYRTLPASIPASDAPHIPSFSDNSRKTRDTEQDPNGLPQTFASQNEPQEAHNRDNQKTPFPSSTTHISDLNDQKTKFPSSTTPSRGLYNRQVRDNSEHTQTSNLPKPKISTLEYKIPSLDLKNSQTQRKVRDNEKQDNVRQIHRHQNTPLEPKTKEAPAVVHPVTGQDATAGGRHVRDITTLDEKTPSQIQQKSAPKQTENKTQSSTPATVF